MDEVMTPVFAESFLNNPWIVQIAVFGVIATMVWLAVDFFGRTKSRSEERLEDHLDPQARRRREEAAAGGRKKNEAMAFLEASAPALAKPLQPKTEKDIGKLKLKLSHAG